MKARTTLATLVVALASITQGCSCGEPSARTTAPDGAAAQPPACVSWCDELTLVGSLDLGLDGGFPRFDAIDGFALSASSNAAAVVLHRHGGDAGARHVIAIVDLATGGIHLGEAAEAIALHNGISGRALRATPEGYEEVVAYPATPLSRLGASVVLGSVAWRADGSLARASDLLMRFPDMLPPCASCERPVAIAGATDADLALAAVVEGPTVLYGVLDGTPAGETGTLLDLGTSSPPGATPISLVRLGDGRAAISWGGAVEGLEPRSAGLAVGRVGQSDWARVEIAGAPFDPGPIVTHAASGIAVVRFTTDTNDIGRSGIRITRYDDATLAVETATQIPTRYGIQPRSIAVLESSNGPGVAFIEPGAAREVDNLYVVPPNDSLVCTDVAPIPSAGLDAVVEWPIAAVWTGDSALVALLTVEGTLRIYRAGPCHVRRSEAE